MTRANGLRFIIQIQSVNLNGLTIVDAADDSFIIDVDLQIPSNGYLTLGINADPTVNGGVDVDYQYNNFRLNNTTDSITIINPELTGDQVVDSVDYDATTFPSASGESVSLDPNTSNSTDNDSADSWCGGKSTYGDGDLGTPGQANDSCDESSDTGTPTDPGSCTVVSLGTSVGKRCYRNN